MIVHPYSEPPTAPLVAALLDPHTVVLENGDEHPLDGLQVQERPVRVFAPWDQVDRYARDGVGELVCWGDDPIRWRAKRSRDRRRRGSDVVIVKLPYPSSEDFLHGLVEWRDWLEEEGAAVGWSLGGTSMSLLRATLERELVTTRGELPPARWTLGGRQHCTVEAGTEVQGAVQIDLPQAYSRTVGGLRYGGAWRCLERPEWLLLETLAEAGWPILVHGSVRLPSDLMFGPLPRRPRRKPRSLVEDGWAPIDQVPYPTRGRLAGMWSFEEAANVVEAGGVFDCDRAWVHAAHPGSYPFAPWLAACTRGRALDGWFAKLLAKSTANALWGQFVIDDDKELSVVSFNGRRYRRTLPGSQGRQVRGWDLGEVICGRVRARLWSMMETAGDALVCAHTDGGWIAGDPPNELGFEWGLKERASTLQVLDQQHLRYLPPDGKRWRYALSGVPAARAEEMFEGLWNVYAKKGAAP